MNDRTKPIIQVAAMSANAAVNHVLQELGPPEFEWRIIDKSLRPGFIFGVADCPKYVSPALSGADCFSFFVLDAEHPHPYPFMRIEGCDLRKPTQICKSCHKVMYSCYRKRFYGDLWRARLCIDCCNLDQLAGL